MSAAATGTWQRAGRDMRKTIRSGRERQYPSLALSIRISTQEEPVAGRGVRFSSYLSSAGPYYPWFDSIVPNSLALYGHSTYGTTSELGLAKQQFVR